MAKFSPCGSRIFIKLLWVHFRKANILQCVFKANIWRFATGAGFALFVSTDDTHYIIVMKTCDSVYLEAMYNNVNVSRGVERSTVYGVCFILRICSVCCIWSTVAPRSAHNEVAHLPKQCIGARDTGNSFWCWCGVAWHGGRYNAASQPRATPALTRRQRERVGACVVGGGWGVCASQTPPVKPYATISGRMFDVGDTFWIAHTHFDECGSAIHRCNLGRTHESAKTFQLVQYARCFHLAGLSSVHLTSTTVHNRTFFIKRCIRKCICGACSNTMNMTIVIQWIWHMFGVGDTFWIVHTHFGSAVHRYDFRRTHESA